MGLFRRRRKRTASLNLLHFSVLGADGIPIDEAVGRTRNISGAGMLIETRANLEPGQKLLLTIDLKGEVAEIGGQVVHIESADGEWYWAGIEFTSLAGEGRQILEKYLEAFLRAS